MTSNKPVLTVLLCLTKVDGPELRSRLARIADSLDDQVDYRVQLVGHGKRERLAPALREVVKHSSRHRMLLYTRPKSFDEALAAGVGIATAPWIVLLSPRPNSDEGRHVLALWEHVKAHSLDAPVAIFDAENDLALFTRPAFLTMEPVRCAHWCLPELLAGVGRVLEVNKRHANRRSGLQLRRRMRQACVAALRRLPAAFIVGPALY